MRRIAKRGKSGRNDGVDVRDFAHLLDQTAASMSCPLLALVRDDCIKLRVWSREHHDYAAAAMFDVAISHINAEIARREETKGPS
jgi:hypothetical protein